MTVLVKVSNKQLYYITDRFFATGKNAPDRKTAKGH